MRHAIVRLTGRSVALFAGAGGLLTETVASLPPDCGHLQAATGDKKRDRSNGENELSGGTGDVASPDATGHGQAGEKRAVQRGGYALAGAPDCVRVSSGAGPSDLHTAFLRAVRSAQSRCPTACGHSRRSCFRRSRSETSAAEAR